MSIQTAFSPSNDSTGKRADVFVATISAAGTLNGGVEGIVNFPPSGADGASAGSGWQLVSANVNVGVNTTHDTTSPLISLTVEKNTDGGTSALLTAPSISNAAGTGRKTTESGAATGIVPAVLSATASASIFADSDTAFLTLLEAGSNGTDPSDVSGKVVFVRLQDFDQDFTV